MKNNYFFILLLFVLQTTYAQLSIYDIARSGSLEDITEVLNQNPDLVNAKSEQGFSPLLLAVYYENETVANYLINKGANVNENSNMGSPLMAAVVKNNETLTKLLLQKGANVDAVDANGTTSLIYAVTFQLKPIVELLLSYQPTIDMKDSKGFSALDYANKLNNVEIIKLLE